MILRLFSPDVEIRLPPVFNLATMREFIQRAVHEQADNNVQKIFFDFSGLRFIEPEGVVVLSNTIEHFKAKGVKVFFRGHKAATEANRYLDDAQFFRHYLGKAVFEGCQTRSTTVPLVLFKADAYVPYLYQRLMPWVSAEVNLSSDTLETIKACLEEIFHNIDNHSGVDSGCTFSQHFPKSKEISIAISDFGVGIPEKVRTKVPKLNDAESLRQAIELGFTTGDNVKNRGWGLPNLIRFVTQRNGGRVLIHSGHGYLSATQGANAASVTSRKLAQSYPGTLVHVVLRTDTLERLETDVQPEEFQW